jgi:RimJ/RimL family protein N-acetyltransferase
MSPSDLTPSLRPLRPRHAAQLLQLRHRAVQEIPEAFGTSPDWELSKTLGHYRAQLIRVQTRRRERLLGLWLEEDLIGMTGLGARRKDNQEYALFYSMYVLPDHRGRGYAGWMLERGFVRATEVWGFDSCRLCVEIHNTPARLLYKKHGFRFLYREPAAFRLKGVPYDVDHLERRRNDPERVAR